MQSNNPLSIRCAYPVIKETVPSSSRGYYTNNKYPDFPPLMSDGRAVTASWQHDAVTNKKIVADNNIQSNWQYRNHLTKNAISIMEQNFREASNDTGYHSRMVSAPSIQSNQVTGFSTPLLYASVNDNSKTLGHTTSDLKNNYLSREELQNRQISPVITQEQLIKSLNIKNTPVEKK